MYRRGFFALVSIYFPLTRNDGINLFSRRILDHEESSKRARKSYFEEIMIWYFLKNWFKQEKSMFIEQILCFVSVGSCSENSICYVLDETAKQPIEEGYISNLMQRSKALRQSSCPGMWMLNWWFHNRLEFRYGFPWDLVIKVDRSSVCYELIKWEEMNHCF